MNVFQTEEEESIFTRLMKDSTIHGVKYIVMPNRPIGERIFWITVLLASTGAAIFMIYGVLQKYNDNPVIVSFQPKQMSILDVPFPAVTICNSNRFKKSSFEQSLKIVEEGENGGHSTEAVKVHTRFLRSLDHICSQSTSFTSKFNYSLNATTVNLCGRFGDAIPVCHETFGRDESFLISKPMDPDQRILFHKSLQPCHELVQLCLFEEEKHNCSHLFKMVVTDMGFCCTFNMMPRHIIFKNITKNNPSDTSEEEDEAWRKFDLDDVLSLKESDEGSSTGKRLLYPKYQSKAGQASGLSILLNPDLENYFCDNGNGFGFKVYAHSPIEYPRPHEFGVAISPNIEIFMSVHADVTRAEKQIENLDVERRKCFYSYEAKLQTFSKYTFSNCVDECIVDEIVQNCQCMRFDMPVRSSDPRWENVTYCEKYEHDCLKNVTDFITKGGTSKMCGHCRHSCNRIEYIAQTSSLPLRKEFEISGYDVSKNATILHVFFGTDNIYSRIRKNIYSFNDMFAHVGALLGLFLGMSVLSVVEPLNWFFRKYSQNHPLKSDSNQNKNSRKIHVASLGATTFQTPYANKLGWQTKYIGDIAKVDVYDYKINRY